MPSHQEPSGSNLSFDDAAGLSILANDARERLVPELIPIGIGNVKLAGEFGRRVVGIVEANILQADVDTVFLAPFRRPQDTSPEGRYVGVGKFLDAVVRLAAGTGDQRLIALKEKIATSLIESQEPDGYIGTFGDPETRLRTLWDLHEAAYVIWAFVSDYELFDQQRSIKTAERLANYVLASFSAQAGLTTNRPWDMPLEIGAVGLDRAFLAMSRVTGDRRFQAFVTDVLDLQNYAPQIHSGATTFANHSYSCLSHCIAQLDLMRQTGDSQLLKTSRKVIDLLRRHDYMLVTGSCSQWECWHDTQTGLDNSSETCVGAYLARLMDAMLQIEGDSLYGDILERGIYNALFAATAPDGSRSRYFTPFEGRRPYDSSPYAYCCNNNNKRFLADLSSWIYYRTRNGVAVNLYNSSTADLKVDEDVSVRIEQRTDYPSSGRVLLKIDPSRVAQFEVRLRIPRWCKQATVSVNGGPSMRVESGRFHCVVREWNAGDEIDLNLPMDWRFIRGRRAQAGRAVVARGPVIFTFNPERNVAVASTEGFDAHALKINPLEIGAPVVDTSLRSDGIACIVKAWLPALQPWLMAEFERTSITLTEYPDPGGTAIYFLVPGAGHSLVMDDELVADSSTPETMCNEYKR